MIPQMVAYIPFANPLPGVWNYWPLLLLPLCAAVAIVYKSIKCHSMAEVPRQAGVIFIWILLGLAASAAILAAVVKMAGR